MEREPGCGDASCIFSVIRPKGGMRTNGGCRCFKHLELNTEIVGSYGDLIPYNNKDDLRHLQRSVMLLVAELRELKGKS